MALTVFVAGNDARGDDALGPRLARRLEALHHPSLTVIDDFQLQVEHVLDLPERGPVLFVDAHCRQREPLRFARLQPAPGCGPASHALAPAEVLAVARQIGRPLPGSWLMSLRGVSFELGAPLSPAAQLSLALGWGLLRRLMAWPDERCWTAFELAMAFEERSAESA